jgi:hypothetical protein
VTTLSWWLVDHASQLLEPDEREAVRGDFSELRITGRHALRDLVGLIARRQAHAWADWRPWLALLGLVTPLGLLLSLVSRFWATSSAIYLWFYVNNWTSAYLASSGARVDLVQFALTVAISYLTLVVWSWTTGFALGSLSGRTIWMNGAVFCFVVFGGTIGSTTAGLGNPANDAVFSLAFYRVVYPVIVRTALVGLPALWGMRQGHRRAMLHVPRAITCAVIAISLTAWTARGLAGSVIFGWWFPPAAGPLIAGWSPLRSSWQWPLLLLLPPVMVWPAAYIVASASWRRGRDRTPST